MGAGGSKEDVEAIGMCSSNWKSASIVGRGAGMVGATNSGILTISISSVAASSTTEGDGETCHMIWSVA